MLSGKRKWNYDHDHIQEWFFQEGQEVKCLLIKTGIHMEASEAEM